MKTKAELVKRLREIINQALPWDPWTEDDNPGFDEDYRAEDALSDIVDLLEPEIEELDKADNA